MRFRSFLLLLACLWLWSAPSLAQDAPDFTGLDVLFIVDQSGSMGGTAYGGAAIYGAGSDPDALRFRAPAFALEQLTLYAEREALERPQVALLSFGTDPDLLLNWTEIDPTQENWQAQLNAVLETVSAERFGERNLGFTDFLRAFAEGRDLIASAPVAGPDERRLSAIVLLTDGSPCVDTVVLGADGAFNCQQPRPEQEAPHLEELAIFMRENLPNTRLYVVALDRDDDYFERLQPFWEGVACATADACDLPLQATQVSSTADLGLQLGRVLSDLVTDLSDGLLINERQADERFEIPPYTQLLGVTVFKSTSAPLSGLQLIGPEGAASFSRDGAETPIEQLQVSLPQPGEWRIDLSDLSEPELAGDLRFQTEAILAVPSAVLDAQRGAVYEPLALNVALTDQETGQPLPIYRDGAGEALFPLSLSLGFYDARPFERATRPEIFRVDLERDPDADGQQFSTRFRPQLPGIYEVRATATYTTPDGATVTLIDGATLVERFEIAASQITWTGFDPASQREDETVQVSAEVRRADGAPLGGMSDLTLALREVDESGQPLEGGAVVYLTDENPDPGVASAAWPIPAALGTGRQRFQLQVGVGSDEDFAPLRPQTPFVTELEVRPVRRLTLNLTLPQADVSLVQEEFPRFWTVTPLTIQLSLSDDQGELVDLAALTDGLADGPALTVTRDGELISDAVPQQVRTGIYQLTLDALSAGQYRIEAEIDTEQTSFIGDVAFSQPPLVAVTHTREDAPYVLPTIGALIAGAVSFVLLLLIVLLTGRRRYVALTRNALSGRLSVSSVENGELVPLWEVDLKDLNRNAYSFSSRELRGLPFLQLDVTNYAANNPQDRKLVTVTTLLARTDAEPREELVPPVLVLQPGESRSLPSITINTVPVEYVIGLDSTPFASSRAESVFSDAAERF